MFELTEQILCYFGYLFLGVLIIMLVGVASMILLAELVELSSKFSKKKGFITQFIRALKEFVVIVGIGFFVGLSVGEAVKSLFDFMPATIEGAGMGIFLSSSYAFSRIRLKWGHCYLDQK